MPAILDHQPTRDVHEAIMEEAPFSDLFCSAMEEVEKIAPRLGTVDAIKVEWIPSVVGPLLAGVHERSLRFVHFADPKHLAEQLMRLQRQLGKPFRSTTHTLHEQLADEMEEYSTGKRKVFTVPMKAVGTTFQQRVWEALRKIPYGSTWSYEQLAGEVGQPTASRAVGLANGANPIAILIPCHRVINKNGQLGGYGGGQWRKQILLHLESKSG